MKPREWWTYKEDLIVRSSAPDGDDSGEYIHVIERSAYDKAIAALKDIHEGKYKYYESCWDDEEMPTYNEFIESVLKELGEL